MNAGLLYLKVDKINSDGTVTEGVAFPSATEQVVLGTYTYEAKRMGGAPTITDSFYFPRCLDKEWKSEENNGEVYVDYEGERFYVSSIPSPTKDNTNGLYKHEITLTSRREILDNTLFFDVVTEHTDTQDKDRYRSNQTKFSFGGDIREFIKRINDSLVYVGIYDPTKEEGKQGYHLVLKDGYGTDDVKEISIDSQYITEVIQEIYNTYNLTYYWKGEVCYVGEYENDLTSEENIVRYGRNEALLSVSEENSNNKIVDMITGYGSSDNIPYYYPNDDEFGEAVFDVKNGTKSSILVSLSKLLKNNKIGTDYLKTYNLCKRDGDLIGEVNILKSFFVTFPSDELVVSDGNYFTRTAIIPIIAKVGMRIYAPKITTKHTCASGVSIKDDTFSFYIDNDREGKYNEVYEVDKGGIVNLVISEQITISSTIGTVTVDNAITYNYEGSVKIEYENQSKYFWNYDGGIVEYDESGISVQDLKNANTAKSIVSFKMITNDVSVFGFGYGFEEKMDESTEDNALSVRITDRIWLDPSQNLMPSIYRESKGAERFYYALNNIHKIPGSDKYYEFKNKYVKGNPHQGSVSFDDIKPTINGIRNDVIQSDGLGQLFGEIADVAFDSNDSDVKDSNGDFVHQYFYIKLHKFSGEFGFDLFSHALAKENAVINMIDCQGCPACAFPIKTQPSADNTKMYNCVSTDENGNLVSVKTDKEDYILDANACYADKLNQNSQEKEIWIAVQKDNSTLGIVMPNAAGNFKPKKGDKFVITGIKPPKVLVTAAEKRLDEALIKYMSENNEDSFNYSIKFSRIFLAENPDYANKLNENAKICLEFNGVKHELFVSNYSVKCDGNALAEVDVELVKSLEVTQSEIKQMIDSVKGDVMNSIGGGLNTGSNNSFNAATADKMYLSKIKDDTAQGFITFLEGIAIGVATGARKAYSIFKDGIAYLRSLTLDEGLVVGGDSKLGSNGTSTTFGDYHADSTGASISVRNDGTSTAEFDYITIRRAADFREITIRELRHIGGELAISAAAMVCSKVETLDDYPITDEKTVKAFKCYFETSNNGEKKVYQQFKVGDQARCQQFDIEESSEDRMKHTRYYWRLVIGVGEDYIVLSDTDKDSGSASEPKAGDNIVQMGYRYDDSPNRQSAIVFSATSGDAPSAKYYQGINDYSLDHVVKDEGYDAAKGTFHANVYGDSYTGDKEGNGYFAYDAKSKTATFKGIAVFQSGTKLPDGTAIEDVTTRKDLEGLNIRSGNLLRNTSFCGDYESADFSEDTDISENKETFSEKLKYWATDDTVSIIDNADSTSGKAAHVMGGAFSQQLSQPLLDGEPYTISFKAKGTTLRISIGTEQVLSQELTEEYKRYELHFTNQGASDMISFGGNNTSVSEIMLTYGTIAPAWSPAYADNDKSMAQYQNIKYLSDAINEASTTIDGGLVMSQQFKVGNFRDKQMIKETGGMSGYYNDGYSPYLWGGGSLEQAIRTIQYYKDDPTRQPSEEELKDMANFVVTHGGRAILNDIILRGYIYAEGGVMKSIKSPNGNFSIDEEGNAKLKGEINATKGNIAGFELDDASMTGQGGDDTMSLSATNIEFNSSYYGITNIIGAVWKFGFDGVAQQVNVSKDYPTSVSYGGEQGLAMQKNVGLFVSVDGTMHKRSREASLPNQTYPNGNHAIFCPSGDYAGFRPCFRLITSSQKITKLDVFLEVVESWTTHDDGKDEDVTYKVSEVTLALPESPEIGQMYWIQRSTTKYTTLKTTDGSHIVNNDGDKGESLTCTANNELMMIWWNGNHWRQQGNIGLH